MKLKKIFKYQKSAAKFLKRNGVMTSEGLILKEGVRTTKYVDTNNEIQSFKTNRDTLDWKYNKEVYYTNFPSEYIHIGVEELYGFHIKQQNKVGGLKKDKVSYAPYKGISTRTKR